MNELENVPAPDNTDAAAGQTANGNPAPAESGKPAEQNPDDKPIFSDEEETDDGSKPEGENENVPETYEDFNIPEGYSVDSEAMSEVKEAFKGMKLSQADAQKLIDLYVKQAGAQKEKALNDWNAKVTQWRKEIRAREGFAKEHELAKAAMRYLLQTPEEKEMFASTSWLSNNPVIFGIFAKAGALVSEDTPLPKGGAVNQEVDPDVKRFPVHKY